MEMRKCRCFGAATTWFKVTVESIWCKSEFFDTVVRAVSPTAAVAAARAEFDDNVASESNPDVSEITRVGRERYSVSMVYVNCKTNFIDYEILAGTKGEAATTALKRCEKEQGTHCSIYSVEAM